MTKAEETRRVKNMIKDFIRCKDYKMAESLKAVYGISTQDYEAIKREAERGGGNE